MNDWLESVGLLTNCSSLFMILDGSQPKSPNFLTYSRWHNSTSNSAYIPLIHVVVPVAFSNIKL